MKNVTFILLTTLFFLLIPSHLHAESPSPDYKVVYDTLITTLNPYIMWYM